MKNIITSAIILLAQTNEKNKYLFGSYKDNGEATSFLKLPEDHKRFVDILRNQQTIMGASTLKATPEDFPDSGRFCVTHHPEAVHKNAVAVNSIQKGIELAKEKAKKEGNQCVFVIGGASIIKQCLEQNLLDKIELTLTYAHQKNVENPVYLEFDFTKWEILKDSGKMISKTSNPKKLNYRFLTIKNSSKI